MHQQCPEETPHALTIDLRSVCLCNVSKPAYLLHLAGQVDSMSALVESVAADVEVAVGLAYHRDLSEGCSMSEEEAPVEYEVVVALAVEFAADIEVLSLGVSLHMGLHVHHLHKDLQACRRTLDPPLVVVVADGTAAEMVQPVLMNMGYMKNTGWTVGMD